MVPSFRTLLFIITIILLETSEARSLSAPKPKSICEETSWCDNPPNYPGDLILSLLKNSTNFPQGLFDQLKSKKTNTDLKHIKPINKINSLEEKDVLAKEIEVEPVNVEEAAVFASPEDICDFAL